MSYNLTANDSITVTPLMHYRFDNLSQTMSSSISAATDHSGNGYNLTQSISSRQPFVAPAGSMFNQSVSSCAHFRGDQCLELKLPPSQHLDQHTQYTMVIVYENHYDIRVDYTRSNTDRQKHQQMFVFSVSSDNGSYAGLGFRCEHYYNYNGFQQHNVYSIGYQKTNSEWVNLTPQMMYLESRTSTDPVVWYRDNQNYPTQDVSGPDIYRAEPAVWNNRGAYNEVWLGGKIGTTNTSYNQGYRGRIYEVFVFNDKLTNTKSLVMLVTVALPRPRLPTQFSTCIIKCNPSPVCICKSNKFCACKLSNSQ